MTTTYEQRYNRRLELAETARKLQDKIIALIGNDAYINFGIKRNHIVEVSFISGEVGDFVQNENMSPEKIKSFISSNYSTVDKLYNLSDRYENAEQFKLLVKSIMVEIDRTAMALLGNNLEEALALLDDLNHTRCQMAMLKFQMNSHYGRSTI